MKKKKTKEQKHKKKKGLNTQGQDLKYCLKLEFQSPVGSWNNMISALRCDDNTKHAFALIDHAARV